MSLKNGFLILSASLILNGCGRVTIGNHEFCGDMGRLGAACFKTLSDDTRDIPKDSWDQERVGMICARAEAFADFKQAVLTLCKMSRRCWYSYDREMLERFNVGIEGVRNRVEPSLQTLLSEPTVSQIDSEIEQSAGQP